MASGKYAPLGGALCVARCLRIGVVNCAGRAISCDVARFGGPLVGVRGITLESRAFRRYASDGKKNHASGVLESDEEIATRRKVLEKFFEEESEEEAREYECDDGLSEEQPFSMHCRLLTTFNNMVGLEEDLVEEEKSKWLMNLDLTTRLSARTRGIILLNMLTFLYGSNVSVIKYAGTLMDPTLFSLGRFAIASLVFSPFFRSALSNERLRRVSLELGLWASMGYLTQCISLLTSDAARVSFISTFTVIVVPLFAGLTGAKISRITWGAAVAALVGVGFLESNGTPIAIGDAWSFVSAVLFGLHILRTEQLSAFLSPEDSLPVISLQLVVITLCSGVWSGATHLSSGDLTLNLSVMNWSDTWGSALAFPWPCMLYTGFFSTALCLWIELVSLRDVKATEAAVIYTVEPLWGAAFAWIFMGERWGPNGWLGATFILGGCLAMQIFGRPEAPRKEIKIPKTGLDVDKIESMREKDFIAKTVEIEYQELLPSRETRNSHKS